MRRRRARPGKALRACPRCGCPTLTPGRAWEGPVVYVHEPLGSGGCVACGFRGVPIEFDLAEDWRRFALECLGSFWATHPPPTPPHAWVVCASCSSPWVSGEGAAPREVFCRVCDATRRARIYPSRAEWSASLGQARGTDPGRGEPS